MFQAHGGWRRFYNDLIPPVFDAGPWMRTMRALAFVRLSLVAIAPPLMLLVPRVHADRGRFMILWAGLAVPWALGLLLIARRWSRSRQLLAIGLDLSVVFIFKLAFSDLLGEIIPFGYALITTYSAALGGICGFLVAAAASSLAIAGEAIEPTGSLDARTITTFVLVLFSIALILRRAAQEKVASERWRIASLSHEMRNTIAAIFGLSRTLADRWPAIDEGDRRLLADRIASGASGLDRMMEDILAFAKAQTKDLPVEAVDVGLVITQTLREERIDLDDHTIEIQAGPDIALKGNAAALQHVLANLISNASKYSPDGTRISIDVRRRGAAVRVSIHNEGAGIPSAQHARIFEPFYRLPGDRRGTGTGIGLALARRLVETQRGSLWVESRPGQGTTFHIDLPAVEHTPDAQG